MGTPRDAKYTSTPHLTIFGIDVHSYTEVLRYAANSSAIPWKICFQHVKGPKVTQYIFLFLFLKLFTGKINATKQLSGLPETYALKKSWIYIFTQLKVVETIITEKNKDFQILNIISFPDYIPFPIGLRIWHVHLYSVGGHVLMRMYPYKRMMITERRPQFTQAASYQGNCFCFMKVKGTSECLPNNLSLPKQQQNGHGSCPVFQSFPLPENELL